MNRRDALALFSALPVAGQDITPTAAEQVADSPASFLSPQERQTLAGLAEKIFPAVGGRPGAGECGVVEFLDFYLSRSQASDQANYRHGLRAVSEHPELLGLLDRPWTNAEPTEPAARFLRQLKEDVLRAAFNSRVWIEQSGRRGGGINYYFKAYE